MEKFAKLDAIVEVSIAHGNLTIVGARNIFSHIDLSFKDRHQAEINCLGNEKTSFFICGLNQDSSFEEIFSSSQNGLSDSIVSDNVVVSFCLNNKHLINEQQSLFFYLGGNTVARVKAYSDGLHIVRYPRNHPVSWQVKRGHMFVIPA